ncbi:DUF6894 family protein [Bradyrhizobium iriomotense]|uniref:DUF6894 domain-containing protein n=1 Tax=Bradyrhizobium iriomotense TaxID=441950 RepID=A0ABQ6B7S0_9BRAD|nr:hypothetical protein [Bradyrhizobium iriomotense]GLR90103.1 hypothetical protein GCM10007857_68170 [Bradyrhizobium iriomotense]
MPRYYFDIRDGEALSVDEEGLHLADQRAAEVEAALSLADATTDLAPSADGRDLAIEVRSAEGPIFRVSFLFEAARPNN